MRPRRLLWQIFPACLAILLVVLLGLTWHFSRSLRTFYIEETAANLTARARLVEYQVAGRLTPQDRPFLDGLCKTLGRQTATRITLVMPTGEVLGDSLEDPARMDNHADRPEVRAALAGSEGRATRYSFTVQKEMMFVAVPVLVAGQIQGVVRTSMAVTAIDAALRTLYLEMVFGGLAAVLAAALLSLFIARRISRPLEEMRHGAERFARGELDRRLTVSGSVEICALAEAMNQMAAHLDDRIRTVLRQRNEQEAVLASMVEGVLAVDLEERILRLNNAAARLLGVRPEQAEGRRIQEVVRKADLQRFVSRALANREPVEGDIVVRDAEGERFLQAHGTVLRGSQEQEIGALIVLNDVTRLRRLETLRRDFVANVSHELKTPITAIKGFVETLLDGAAEDPENAQRFLQIINRQADRLNAIIDDLLDLSRIEQEAEKGGIPLVRGGLRPVLEAAVQGCSLSAREKSLEIVLHCSGELAAQINAPLLEQAIVNLLTNAIKYSDPAGRVVVDAGQFGDKVMIKVQDWGCGISPEHLPRLFERFYRVDKARSRKQGGTGLGLAIVKHIVQSHGGEVVVHSTPGQGSTFTLILPAVS
jgi:two-component system, OmpR family, phosphate regulon sensor histidine kinase PhoR